MPLIGKRQSLAGKKKKRKKERIAVVFDGDDRDDLSQIRRGLRRPTTISGECEFPLCNYIGHFVFDIVR